MQPQNKNQRKSYPSDIGRRQFALLEPIIRKRRKKTGRPRADLYEAVNGMLYVLSTGCRWRDLPHDYGVSYTTCYRYFIYLSGLKTRPVTQKVPVYSIVFPLSLVDQVDQTFGDLGLIYPQYERYSPETAKIECVGQDSNLSDPMFGFTK